MRTIALLGLLALTGCGAKPLTVASPGGGGGEQLVAMDPEVAGAYQETIDKVSGMVGDPGIRRAVTRRGLDVMNVTWEDTGRAEGSALGPNISDVTLQVRYRTEEGFHSALMPVIRFPNFTDRTGDVPVDKFFVRVGNEREGTLHSVPLIDVLKRLDRYTSVPDSLGGARDLTADRDSHFLVSAQAVFLPIPREGKAEFNPVVFNYQSAPGSPAVLTLLVTRQGTSIRVIENRGEDSSQGSGGQELYFNDKGKRSSFTAERKSDVERRISSQGGPRTQDDRTALQRGADVLFLVQVPLIHAQRGVLGGQMMQESAPMAASAPAPAPPSDSDEESEKKSDVEQAVLGHGPHLGPYTEGHGARLVRDPKFPIRITVQFYKATSNGVVSDKDLDGIARSIGGVYEHADFVGSLVLPEGDPRRPTAWQTMPGEWFPW